MKNLEIKTDPRVQTKFESYPKNIKPKLENLRSLILNVANESETISEIEETLKWGEPSYLVNKGSTVRIDWKVKSPNQFAIYFKCTSKLVETFRAHYGNLFNYEKNRALVFKLNDSVPEEALKQCVRLALHYHSVKHLPKLGLE